MFSFFRSILIFLQNVLFKGNLDFFARKPLKHFLQFGSGRCVSVFVNDIDLDNVVLQFERHLGSSDIADGKLIPLTLEKVKKRGGKRLTRIRISYETAEALYAILKPALKDARQRQEQERALSYFGASLRYLLSKDTKRSYT